jgi:hypothetical protein
MYYYLIVAVLMAHTAFWGAGLAWLITPRRWRMVAPLLALPAGLALQSAVVWAAGWLPVAGTDDYGRAALIVPLGLLVVAWRRDRRGAGWSGAGGRFNAVVLALALAVALFAVSPWARAGGGLTTITNGSCDAADYAAGARVFMEFLPADRSGFLGQREVAGVGQVDNFHDHWRQLNHFTPAALLALNASVLGRPVHELCGVLGALLLATLVPMTVLVARGVVRLPRRAALGVASLVGLGPLQNYAVYQVALGQMLAATAVGLLLWGGFGLLRAARWPGRAWAWAGVLTMAAWLLVGSYTFFLVVALAPVAGVVGWALFQRGAVRSLGRAGLVLGSALLLAGAYGWERLEGFALRWNLHDTVEYGWPIPRLWPDGWLGLVASAELHPVALAWGGPVALLLLVAAVWPWRRWVGRDPLRAWTVAGMIGPAVIGYAILSVKGSVPGSNASYDAYKLLACFQPVLLAGLLWWWRLLRGWPAVLVPLAAVLAVVAAGSPLRARAAARPLAVRADLVSLQQLEQRPDVRSVNILCGEMWPRLWANALLLRKEQYFSVPTYEGRKPTQLKGEWNLRDPLVRVRPRRAADEIPLAGSFALVRAAAPVWLTAALGAGWHPLEREGRDQWQWAADAGRIEVNNPGADPVRVDLRLRAKGFKAGRVILKLDGRMVAERPLDAAPGDIEVTGLELPAGASVLTCETGAPAVSPGGGDDRRLSLALFDLVISAAAGQ